MPSTGIHLLVGYELNPHAPDAFWVGCFAPDHIEERAPKTKIHLRDVPDRLAALTALRDSVHMADPFERDWVLHLFTDRLWDEGLLAQYKNEYTGNDDSRDDWFLPYRSELGITTDYLYGHMPWMREVQSRIQAVDVSAIQTDLPVDKGMLDAFRMHIGERFAHCSRDIQTGYYSMDVMRTFAKETATAFRDWMRG